MAWSTRRIDDDGTVVEGFSWSADGGTRSGEMRLTVEAGRIRTARRRLRLTAAAWLRPRAGGLEAELRGRAVVRARVSGSHA